jgi:peptidoglycan/LPS O-acetylase OafA/YrhL
VNTIENGRPTLALRATGRDNNLNLIRLVAAFAVLVGHSVPLATGVGGATEPLVKSLGIPIGAIAVDVFFVISGFLVTGSLLAREDALDFVCGRALRVFPALLVVVALTVFGLGPAFTTLPLRAYLSEPGTWRHLFQSTSLISIHYQLPGVFEANPFPRAVNGSLWTLPIEVRLYAALLFLWALLRPMRRQLSSAFEATLVVLALGSTAWHLREHFHPGPHVHTVRLVSMFFAGAAYYVARTRVPLSWGVFGACGFALVASAYDTRVFFFTYSATLAYVVLFLAYVPGGPVRAYNRLGDYSYGTYIYAFPVQQSVAALVPGVSVPAMTVMAGAVTLACAALSWHVVEKPALALRRRCVEGARRSWTRARKPDDQRRT